jgi:negative regulator of sigma E activity
MNIDRIARAMVDVEPSVDLEARIRARLRDTRRARPATWLSWRVAVPLGAAAAVALALIIGVQDSRSSGVTSTVDVQAARTLPADAALAGASVQAGAGAVTSVGVRGPRSRGVAKTSQRSRSNTSVLTSEEMAWMERRIPALDPVNALEMDRLRVDSIQPEPLAITPLTMTPVATEGGGTERRNDR